MAATKRAVGSTGPPSAPQGGQRAGRRAMPVSRRALRLPYITSFAQSRREIFFSAAYFAAVLVISGLRICMSAA